jgi:hypothetical protein
MQTCSPFLSQSAGTRKGKIWTILILCLWTINATACNFASPKTNAQPPPQNLRKPLVTGVSIQDARDLSAPATKSDGFGSDPQVILKGETDQMMGLKTNTLFSEKLSNDDARFDRLENTVGTIHQDLAELKPSIKRLVSVERDLQDLMMQLDALLNEKHITPRRMEPAEITPPQTTTNITAKPVKTVQQQARKPLPQIDSSKATIQSLRLADHAGKTRLVIETTQNMKYSASLDQNENLLILSFDKGDIAFDPSDLSKKSKLVNAVTTTSEGNGLLIIIELAKTSDLIQQGRIKPNKDSAYHRIFIDLKR